MSTANLILDKKQTLQKIRRIAFEIYEHNFKEKDIVLAGLDGMGYNFVQLLQKELEDISPIKVILVKVSLDKGAPSQSEVTLDTPIDQLKNKTIVVVDDVLNTGKTLAYSLKPFLNIKVKKLQTAVLVNRGHHSFPIIADYVGLSLATSLKEHIEVVLKGKEAGVYLS
ncbi:MAG TPA: phosphoribosyltransferase family protein [Cytophagaceae bacterium]|jgi:pyrimidine operon attenuation protein/uracil phosphoribosyltransferase|nr:phosphoribosyltransferase family protein [Cytophagaceae bacterium]